MVGRKSSSSDSLLLDGYAHNYSRCCISSKPDMVSCSGSIQMLEVDRVAVSLAAYWTVIVLAQHSKPHPILVARSSQICIITPGATSRLIYRSVSFFPCPFFQRAKLHNVACMYHATALVQVGPWRS